MRQSSRIIIVTGVLLAVIIVSLVIVTHFHLTWLWPTEKWPDFWVALISGVITLATVGAIVTFAVEQILKDLEKRRLEKQFQTDCESRWAEFKQRLIYRLLEEISFTDIVDYASMATPHDISVLASLLETVPLSQWERGLSPLPLLFTNLQGFTGRYSLFKMSANGLARNLRNIIDQYNRNHVASGHTLDAAVSENAQQAFCLGLILEDYELTKEYAPKRADTKNGSPEAKDVETLYKVAREVHIEKTAEDLLWYLHLPSSALPNLLAVYVFVKEKVDASNINTYGSRREELKKYAEEIRDTIIKEESDIRRDKSLKETEAILERINKQRKYEELDSIYLTFNRLILEDWKNELKRDQSVKDSDFIMILDQLIERLEQVIKKMEKSSS